MKTSQLAIAVLTAAVMTISLAAEAAPAKGRGRYTPSRPTISPYNNLFRVDSGPLPNYHTFVRPQLEQMQLNAQQGADVGALQGRVGRIEALPAGGVAPTGVGAGFRNFGQFYRGLR